MLHDRRAIVLVDAHHVVEVQIDLLQRAVHALDHHLEAVHVVVEILEICLGIRAQNLVRQPSDQIEQAIADLCGALLDLREAFEVSVRTTGCGVRSTCA